MAVIIDGTNGITTPTGTGDVSVGDDLTFTGTGNRITGDFSTGTTANRVAFQTSTASGATIINVLPGSGAIGSVGHNYFNDPNVNNCARFEVGILNAGTEARLSSTIIGSGSYLPMTFLTGGSERARIDVSGRLLVGTTGFNGGATIGFQINATNNTASQFAQLIKNSNGTEIFQMRCNGGLANFSANNVNLSDERVKTDIKLASSYLDKICAIPVKTFKYKNQTDDLLNLGVIAQDVEAVAPELVDVNGFGETPDDGIPLKAIYETDLKYALMKCIQEQQTLIQALTARIEALEQEA